MLNKKIFIMAFVLVLAFSCSAFAEGLKIGILERPIKEQDFKNYASAGWKWSVLADGHGEDDKFIYYDNLSTMMMALNAGEIDEIDLPRVTAEYVTATNPNYRISCVMTTDPISFVFGFLKDKNAVLWQRFNYVLSNMRKDGTLEELKTKYLSNPGKNELEPIKFDSFPNAETVKVAVTGDVPPLDYTTPDGQAAGFNTAILAEIGRRLKINIEIININTGARTAALVSGRADVIFWYIYFGFDIDIPEGVIFSEPYYTFDEFLQIRRK